MGAAAALWFEKLSVYTVVPACGVPGVPGVVAAARPPWTATPVTVMATDVASTSTTHVSRLRLLRGIRFARCLPVTFRCWLPVLNLIVASSAHAVGISEMRRGTEPAP